LRPFPRDHAAHGSLFFCPDCGDLLDPVGEQALMVCQVCGHTRNARDFEGFEVVTQSAPTAFPSTLKRRRELVQNDDALPKQAATIKERCPKCDAPEMSFHTAQLRSADEGQTVFYSCGKCGYKYSINS